MPPPLVLASASPARLALLIEAGFDPVVMVSGVDEASSEPTTAATVLTLAEQKASAVASGLSRGLVLGCDSLLDIKGQSFGKPATAVQARDWWQARRGASGVLYTGHFLIDIEASMQVSEVVATTVHFARPSDEEIDAYLATGEASLVAGAFTLAGRSAPFIESVQGDPCSVEGLSLAALRRLINALGYSIVDLWRSEQPQSAAP